jgi:hypothetical protein
MTEKQLGNAVIRGRKITFARTGELPLMGYLSGWDDDSFLVLVPEVEGIRTHILQRKASPWQELHPESTLDSEKWCQEIETTLGPFRRWVQDNLLRIPSPKSR